MDVHGQPEEREDDDNEDDETTRLPLLVLRLRLLVDHSGPLTLDVVQDEDGQYPDDAQRKQVSEREERGVEPLRHETAVVLAFRDAGRDLLHTVRAQDRDVDDEHDDPDGADHEHDSRLRAQRGRAYVVYDRHVADGGYQHERVHRHVRRHVQQVVHQLADYVPERPDGGDELVRGEWRADEHERQIGEGKVQEE